MKRFCIHAVLGLAAVIAVTAGVGVATGAIPSSSDGTISACVANFNGTKYLRPIDKQAGEKCKTGEKPVNWNQKGPKGDQGPQGPRGATGPAGSGALKPQNRFGNEDVAPGTTNQIDAFCKPDEHIVSGGFFTGVNGAKIRLTASGPLIDTQGWSIEVVNEGNASDAVTAQAVCTT